MSKKIPSKLSYKVAYLIALIAGSISLFIGIISITVGGFIFVLFGAFFLFLYYTYKKTWMNYDSIYKKTAKNASVETITKNNHISDIPITKPESDDKPTKTANAPENISIKSDIQKSYAEKEKHHIAGTSFRQNEIKSLGIENPDYSLTKKEIEEICLDNEKIYELDFILSKVELVEEPTNEHDPNAVKVIVDGIHVGYIKKGSCSHVKKLLRENKVKELKADIHGGKYKYLEYDYDTDKYRIRHDKSAFFVDLYIYKQE